eukprot:403341809
MMIPAAMIAHRVRERSQLNQKSQTLMANQLKPSNSSRRILNEDSTQSQFFNKRNSSLNHSNSARYSNQTNQKQYKAALYLCMFMG